MFQQIKNLFRKLTTFSPDNEDSEKIEEIKEYERNGKIDLAIQNLEDINFNDDFHMEKDIMKCRMLACSGKLEKSIETSRHLLKKVEHKQRLEEKLRIKVFEGLAYVFQNELEKLSQAIQEAKSIISKLSQDDQDIAPEGLGWYYAINGFYFEKLGKLDLALDNYDKCIPYFKQLNYKYYLSVIYGHIGRIFDSKGNLDKAIEYFREEIVLAEKTEEYNRLGRCSQDIASVFWKKNKINEAIKFYKNSLNLFEKVDNKLYVAESLYFLIRLLVDSGNEEEAEKYLTEFKSLIDNLDDQDAQIRYQLSNAYILKNKKRLTTRALAYEKFKQIAHDDIVHHELTFFAILNLLDLLIKEHQLYGEEDVLPEIRFNLSKLQQMAEDQESKVLLIESMVLQSKLHLINLNIREAVETLNHAEYIARDHGIDLLTKKVSIEQDRLLDQLEKWEDISPNSSIEERLELAGAKEIVNQLLDQKSDPVKVENENSIMFLIIHKNGSSIFNKKFVSLSHDDQLIAGFITAINNFMGEIFDQIGYIDRIRYLDYSLILKKFEDLLLCYVFEGASYNAVSKINRFKEEIRDSEIIQKWLKKPHVLTPEVRSYLNEKMSKIFVS